ncbi:MULTISPECIES: helix-turn-helix transcriptional regulator [Paenibacillus]|uniref:helix-turn-helix transcriptional regulator n=1 Tax=Paenibacillus TaxID=44249 RepID=UPI0022B930F0|nr:AraC family transcriptional regulator [Paenibacillus caseinilyticus]MCZ8522538.1 AraC family transcriptional regulator [Paenibacillus caseinilyticus]
MGGAFCVPSFLCASCCIRRGFSLINHISVTDIAEFVGLNRSYLCSLFKDHSHSSIQSYLVHYRMQKACELMKQRELSIGDISRSVGYEDPLLFSKMFRKQRGESPKQYRTRLMME